VCSLRRRLECSEGAAWGWLFDHALESWGANEGRVRREHRVFARDGWRCTVPGCTSYRNLHDHHIVFRSVGGDDDLVGRAGRRADQRARRDRLAAQIVERRLGHALAYVERECRAGKPNENGGEGEERSEEP